MFCNWAIGYMGIDVYPSDQNLEEQQRFNLLAQLMNLVRSVAYVFWFFFSTSIIKDRKIT